MSSTETNKLKKVPQIENLMELATRLGSEGKKLIDNIIGEFIDRSRKDIKKWRDCIKDIENPHYPNRSKYHDLNRDLSIDLHLESQIAVRKLATMCNRYRIMNRTTGEENEDLTRQIRKKWFRTILSEFLQTKLDGTSVLEAVIEDSLIRKFEILPKRNIIPERQEITKRSNFYKGIKYRDNPEFPDHMIIELGEARDPGLMIKLAPQIIWKRNAQQAWADFSQLFGMPYRKATTNKSDKATLDKIEYMLKKMGAAGYGIYPEGTNIELVADGSRDAYQVYDAQIERCNSEISKGINGVTMLSDDGSSRSQSQVHYKVNEKIVQSDMEEFESFVNDTLIPEHLIPIGYKFSQDDEFEFDMTESLAKKDHWEIVEGILKEYEVEPEWIEKTFGVPIIGKKQNQPDPFKPAPGDPADPQNRIGQVHLIVPEYSKVRSQKSEIRMESNEYTSMLRSIAEEIFDKENKADIPKGLYTERSKQLLNAFSTGFKDRLNVDWDSPDNYKIALYQANIFRFSGAGTWSDVQNLNELRKQAKNFDEFKQSTELYANTKAHHLETEYNSCESIAQNGANWLRQQEDKDHYDLMYQTAGDSNVRDSHRALDGYVAPVDAEIWDSIYPPNAWNCRCEVVQIPAGSRTHTDHPIPDDAVQKGWTGNRGKLNTIFRYNESYLKEFPEIDNFNRRTFGLDKFSDLYKGKKNYEVLIKDQNEFLKGMRDEADRFDGKAAYYRDWLGRHFEVNVDDFRDKFVSQKEERWSMFPLVKEILLTPDEVWMTKQKKQSNQFTTRYLKAFKNKTLVVVAKTENDKLLVSDWYAVEKAENKVGGERTGIIMKGK